MDISSKIKMPNKHARIPLTPSISDTVTVTRDSMIGVVANNT